MFDVDTAVTAYAKLRRPPFGFLLESVVGGEQWARYTFLGSEPTEAWRLIGGRAEIWTPGDGWTPVPTRNALADLDRRLRSRQPLATSDLPRLWGGAVGYFGYDVVRQIEHLPDPPPDDLHLPDGLFVFIDVVLAIDNLLGRAMAIATVEVEEDADDEDLRKRYNDAAAKTRKLVTRLSEESSPPPLELGPEPAEDPTFASTMSREEFEAGVERIRDYITAGDAFQVVLSQRLQMALPAGAFDLYRALRSLNPSPYLYFLELDGLCLVGSSPEVLVRVEDDVVTVRPVAGTRPRGANPRAGSGVGPRSCRRRERVGGAPDARGLGAERRGPGRRVWFGVRPCLDDRGALLPCDAPRQPGGGEAPSGLVVDGCVSRVLSPPVRSRELPKCAPWRSSMS